MDNNLEKFEAAGRTLALIKFLQKRLTPKEKEMKTFLTENGLTEGEKITVADQGGNPIATLSRSKEGAPSWQIEDSASYLAWCEKHGKESGAVVSYDFPDWVTDPDRVAEMISETGEIPAGMVQKPGRAGSVRATFSAQQTARIEHLLSGVDSSLKGIGL